MTRWEQYDFAERIRSILRDAHYYRDDHHMGRPFLSPYQIAIEFERRHPDDVAAIGLPIGGKDTQQHTSLAQYIARELSSRLRSELTDVEGGFLSNLHLAAITFRHGAHTFASSLTETQYDLSLFRLRDAPDA